MVEVRSTFAHWKHAFVATALFRIWPHLVFMGAWSAMVCLVNVYTKVEFHIPSTMITVLGVLLGLTISYRTSSAYEKYSEGRKLWGTIILSCRNWARCVWFHCPDSLLEHPPTDTYERARDEAAAVIEKKTVVQLGLAFAVAVKHYLRGEEGIHLEDLYHLVKFLPSLHLPTGMAANNATMSPDLPGSEVPLRWSSHSHEHDHGRAPELARVRSVKRIGAKHKPAAGRNVPLEVTMFMSEWVSVMQTRKSIDVPTINTLLAAIAALSEAVTNLERILTTPIPWSYNAHIWEVSWIYCLALPFQLWDAKFGWVTIPATMITAYIVMGYAAIAEEIENPFGYDKNDLNLEHFCREVIAKELDAITSKPRVNDLDKWIFSSENHPFGARAPSAQELVKSSVESIREHLATSACHDGTPRPGNSRSGSYNSDGTLEMSSTHKSTNRIESV